MKELPEGHPCFCSDATHAWHEEPGTHLWCGSPVIDRTAGGKVKKICEACRQANDVLVALRDPLLDAPPPVFVGPDGRPLGERRVHGRDDTESDGNRVSLRSEVLVKHREVAAETTRFSRVERGIVEAAQRASRVRNERPRRGVDVQRERF
jgi:hypothetical protein